MAIQVLFAVWYFILFMIYKMTKHELNCTCPLVDCIYIVTYDLETKFFQFGFDWESTTESTNISWKADYLISWKYSHVSLQLKLGYRMGLSLATSYFKVYSGQKVIIIENLPVFLVHQFQNIVYSNFYGHSLLLSNLVTGESQYHLCYKHIICMWLIEQKLSDI